MTTDAEDRPTWPRNGQIIRRAELLRLIEDNGGPEGLDLRGALFVGDGPSGQPRHNPIALSPDALAPLAEAYRQANGGLEPPWLTRGGGMDLRTAHLEGANLHLAQLQGACLVDAQVQEAHLVHAQLEAADLWGAQLQGARLVYAQLQGARLWYAELQGADLQHAHLHAIDMYDVISLDSIRWYGALLDHTRIKRESLGKAVGDEIEAHETRTAEAYHRAKEAYLLLKNNFNQIGRYEDASWAYVKEQQMQKMAFYWEHRWRLLRPWWRVRRWRFLFRRRHPHNSAWGLWWLFRRRACASFVRWLRNWAYELATGYGERPWNPVIGGVLTILAFAGGFCATRAIANFWDALVYSIATFATFNLARPGLNPQGPGAEVASSLEAILGISVLALVVFTLGNRMSRG